MIPGRVGWTGPSCWICLTSNLQRFGRNRNISLWYQFRPRCCSLVSIHREALVEYASQVLMAHDKKSRWKVPLGLMATGVAGAAVLVFRGCWHRKMSWPVRYQQHSYQVCLGCGIKRLFDEKSFCAYGAYSYDLNKLISWDLDQQAKEAEDESVRQRPA
jgi:hypothetical protein